MKKVMLIIIISIASIELISMDSFKPSVDSFVKIKRIEHDGTILKSTDGGISWNIQLKDDIKVLFIRKDGLKYLSTNTGSTWILVDGNESDIENKINIYPHPVENELSAKFINMNEGNYELKIYNILGNEFYREKVLINPEYSEFKLDIHRLVSGYYLITLKNNSVQYNRYFYKK